MIFSLTRRSRARGEEYSYYFHTDGWICFLYHPFPNRRSFSNFIADVRFNDRVSHQFYLTVYLFVSLFLLSLSRDERLELLADLIDTFFFVPYLGRRVSFLFRTVLAILRAGVNET